MYDEYSCKSGIIKSKTLTECSNEQLTPTGINGPLVGKIPVVLAEPVVQIDVESIIELEDPTFEIKRIKKNLFITQCKVINVGLNTGKLFLSGYVRKNIEYATAECIGRKRRSISGDIKHTTVNVPFQCVTKINYVNPPHLCSVQETQETASFIDTKDGDDYCSQKIIGRSPCEQSFQHYECFNEKIYCELEDVRIYEDDIQKNPKEMGCKFPHEYTFDSIIEKMVILVRLKLLQKQQVSIPAPKMK